MLCSIDYIKEINCYPHSNWECNSNCCLESNSQWITHILIVHKIVISERFVWKSQWSLQKSHVCQHFVSKYSVIYIFFLFMNTRISTCTLYYEYNGSWERIKINQHSRDFKLMLQSTTKCLSLSNYHFINFFYCTKP